jgi:hypothetical protein
MRTTFFTCCNKKYECFIPIFIHSTLYHNDVDIEICVEDDKEIGQHIINSIKYIKEKYSKTLIKIRSGNFNSITIENKSYKIIPNIVRFLETPTIKNSYVYICDIDIIILQRDIQNIHVLDMDKMKSNYSNIVRPNSNKLTGLHFSKWINYYPIPDYEDLVIKGMLNDDEFFLYNLVKKKNIILKDTVFRPVHGIHASQNRENICDWGIKQWKKQWEEYRNSEEFLYLEHNFSDLITNTIKRIDEYYLYL